MKARIYNNESIGIPSDVVWDVIWYTTGNYGLRDVEMQITDGKIEKVVRVQFENIDWLENN